MTEKRFKYSDFCEIIIDILENEENGVSTRVLDFLFFKRTGKRYWDSGIRPKLHRMRKDGLIEATYSVDGYRWWNKTDKINVKNNEVVVE